MVTPKGQSMWKLSLGIRNYQWQRLYEMCIFHMLAEILGKRKVASLFLSPLPPPLSLLSPISLSLRPFPRPHSSFLGPLRGARLSLVQMRSSNSPAPSGWIPPVVNQRNGVLQRPVSGSVRPRSIS